MSAVATAMLLGTVHVLHAEPPSFAPGETLSASKMNASFASLSNRIDALEKANAVPAVPAGTIVAFGGPNVPEGWVTCDGVSLGRVAEPTLFTAIGTSWGAEDENHFNLPDLRGLFLRGVDGTAGRDPDKAARVAAKPGGNTGNAVGSIEGEMFLAHAHTTTAFGLAVVSLDPGAAAVGIPSGNQDFGSSVAGGSETRPKNANVIYIIKR